MVTFLDDWLIFGQHIPPDNIQQEIERLGVTINYEKSALQPTQCLKSWDCRDVQQGTITSTGSCIWRTMDYAPIIPRTTLQDLRRIAE
jgi:hypothetical protein